MTISDSEDIIITRIKELSEELDIRLEKQNRLLQKDSFRKKSDIRNIDVSKLTWYQKIQLKRVSQQIAEFENTHLRKRIFNTFRSEGDDLVGN
jgi:hypothetical protein